ncbi:hypothetical protein QVN42_13120 [Yersinia nurmii]|uniref:Uncharacterized protein n=1 Tax=Yersinia nurmii TaxID=685706 RepID=A0AAW7K0H8_9GAMM|nr:hypothetical protein [Yersinia nurmii]MDN0088309.1 hypothetical protein [Yersinia nurmii]
MLHPSRDSLKMFIDGGSIHSTLAQSLPFEQRYIAVQSAERHSCRSDNTNPTLRNPAPAAQPNSYWYGA